MHEHVWSNICTMASLQHAARLRCMVYAMCHVACCELCQMHKQTVHPSESSLAVGIAGLRHDVVQPKYASFAERAVRHVKVLGHARCSDCRIRLLRAL